MNFLKSNLKGYLFRLAKGVFRMRMVLISHKRRILLIALLFLGILFIINSGIKAEKNTFFDEQKVEKTVQNFEHILQMDNAQVIHYIQTLAKNGFPLDEMDELHILALNKSEVVLPTLEREIVSALSNMSWSNEEFGRATDVIAYVANESTIEIICRLVQKDQDLFLPLLERSFGYAVGRTNFYHLAYDALGCKSQLVTNGVKVWFLKWLNKYGDTNIGYPMLADAVIAMADDQSGITLEILSSTDPLLIVLYGENVPSNVLNAIERKLNELNEQ